MPNVAPQPVSDRDQRKAEQAQTDRARARKQKLMKAARWLGIAAIVAAVLGGLMFIAEQQDGGMKQPNPTSNEVTAIDHVKGNPDAAVTVIEYADFQCPACRSYAPVVHELTEAYGDRVQFVYRHFPLKTLHPNAVAAARASEAAHLQGKFWEMNAALFASQDEWTSLANPTDAFAELAREFGLDEAKFRTDMNSKEVRQRVEADYGSGVSARITGTPTFFINGKKLEENPRGLEAFQELLENYLSNE